MACLPKKLFCFDLNAKINYFLPFLRPNVALSGPSQVPELTVILFESCRDFLNFSGLIFGNCLPPFAHRKFKKIAQVNTGIRFRPLALQLGRRTSV
ncbi:unnamed protein product, partial [Ixodes pacificus]